MARTYEITFLPAHKTGEAYDGETILEAAARMNVAIRADCGDAGICGKCRVIVDNTENLSEINSTELDALSNRQIEESQRLSCQSEIEGPIVVTVPEELSDKTEVFGKTELTGSFKVDPAIERIVIDKQQSLGVGSSEERNLAEWVQKRVKAEHGKDIQFEAFEPIRELAELIKKFMRFHGELSFDTSKPDGTPRKIMDVSTLDELGWTYSIGIEEGIQKTIQEFEANPVQS